MEKKNKTYSIEESPLYGLKSRKKLLELFYIKDYKMLEILSADYGNYKVYDIPNKNKPTKRTIEEPKDVLKRLHKQFISDYYKLAYYAYTFTINGVEVNYNELSPMCKDLLVDYAMAINSINYDYKYVVEDIPFNREGFANVVEQIGDEVMSVLYSNPRTR